MKKIIMFLFALVLIIATAAPALAVTPAFKVPKLPKNPVVKTELQVTVTDGFWVRWFREHPAVILAE